jgi:acyl-CoA synthetase (AMP-forming)/AMP-acid ligase II
VGIRQPDLSFKPTVPSLLGHAVDQFGDREFVVTEGERVTYRQAEIISRRLAKRLLEFGVGKGTRIATMFPYGVEWIVSWLAIERIGALHIPLSTAYKPAELRLSLQLSDAHLLIAPRRLFGADHQAFVADALPGVGLAVGPIRLPAVPSLRAVWFEGGTDHSWASNVSFLHGQGGDPEISDDLVFAVEGQVSPADLALVIYTSGTTSQPKGVCHTHGALVRKGAHIAALREWDSDEKIFCGLPFFWVGGIGVTIVPAMVVGAGLLCVDKTDPIRSLDLMERERATVMTGWPGVRGPIATHPTRVGRDIPALEVPDFGFGRPHSSLGMTETLGSYTFAMGGDEKIPIPAGRKGSMGPVIDGAEVRIADPETLEPLPEGTEGAILVRGYFLTAGLYKRERENVFTRDGFYNTQDKGYILGDLLFFTGRLTDVIKTSGNNVSPSEVEAVLNSLPEVRIAHVLGIPDPERGEVVAALVAANGDAIVDPDELRA